MIELDPTLGWINTDQPLLLGGGLKGQVVVLLFWDSGRVSGNGAVAEVLEVASQFSHEPVVLVGIHDSRFPMHASLLATRRAVHRLGLRFPVAVDRTYAIWRKYTVRSSPTVIVVDPIGAVAARASGEGNVELLARTISRVLDEHRSRGTLATGRAAFSGIAPSRSVSGLIGPEKIVAQTPSVGRPGHVVIADTGQHRVIVSEWPDVMGSSRVRFIVGDGHPGLTDGEGSTARFRYPRGMSIDPERGLLYVADSGNHAIRLVDLHTGTVRTIIGSGVRGHGSSGGASGTNQTLHTPVDVSLATRSGRLFIAMAGMHQIWSAELDTMVTRAMVGTGQEDVIDGPGDKAAFAQPAAIVLSCDSRVLYVLDAEGSAVRAVDLRSRAVRTIAGGSQGGGVPALDSFGHQDGESALFARPHGLAIRSGGMGSSEELLIADTGNGKIRVLDGKAKVTSTLEVSTVLACPCDVTQAVALASRTEPPTAFVADTDHHRIIRLNTDGNGWTEIGLAGLERDAAKPAERAVFNVPMHVDCQMSVPGLIGDGVSDESVGRSACFRVSSWDGDVETAVVCQRTLVGSASSIEQQFMIPAPFVDLGLTLLVETSCEADPFCDRSWRVRFGPDGGEPKLRHSCRA